MTRRIIVRFWAAGVIPALLCFAQEPLVFRTGQSLVHVDAEVADRSGPLVGLHKEDFLIKDNGEPQPVLYFSQESEPLDVILLFDICGSMRPNVE